MTDHLSPERRSENMRRILAKDTKPEMLVRQTAHGLGYRFKLHDKDLPGKPDIVFPAKRAVIFVHGCFWHSHDCKKGRRVPRSNSNYWVEKREKNQARHEAAVAALLALGWRVLTIWECETKDRGDLADRIRGFLDPGLTAGEAPPVDPGPEADATVTAVRGALTALAEACRAVRVTSDTPDDVLVELLRSRLIAAGSVEAWCERITDLGGPVISPRRLRTYVMEHLIYQSTRVDPKIREALVFEDWQGSGLSGAGSSMTSAISEVIDEPEHTADALTREDG